MIFIALSFLVPIVIYATLPYIITWLSGRPPIPRTLLLIAGALYLISWYLPSPLINGSDTDFTTHFVGGGLFSGFLWLYIKKQLNWKLSPLIELFTLYLLVSGLGVANELLELLLTEIKIVHLSAQDAWWDLLANTLGALTFWLLYKFFSKEK